MPEESKIRCATRADVAKRAGVSVTVVSYVLNNNRYVEKEKRARVLQAARELHYTPNNIARALKGKSSHHIIFIVDNIINQLNENKSLLTFIAKNLSWGVFKHALTSPIKDDDIDFRNIYDAMLADAPYDIVQPEVMIFMIVELVSSTCYSSILYNEPVDIGELKPYLYICINNIIDTHAGTVKA